MQYHPHEHSVCAVHLMYTAQAAVVRERGRDGIGLGYVRRLRRVSLAMTVYNEVRVTAQCRLPCGCSGGRP